MVWHFERCFNCDIKSVIYMLICNSSERFYLGKKANLKQIIRKHK